MAPPSNDSPDKLDRAEVVAERLMTALRSLPMFRGLSQPDRERVARVALLRDYDRGEFLWRAGDQADHLTLIVRGQVKIVRHTESGDVILEIFGVGEPVGAIAVYNGIPYPASAACMEPTTLVRVPSAEYFELLERNPDFARAIIRELTRLTVALTRKLGEMRGQRVDVRIARLFLTLAERMGRTTDAGIEIPLQLSRQEIAELVGTTVESAIRVMSRWGREGVLVTGEKRFVLPSREVLERIAEGRDEET